MTVTLLEMVLHSDIVSVLFHSSSCFLSVLYSSVLILYVCSICCFSLSYVKHKLNSSGFELL